jgi:hypothetical protein
VRALSRQIEKLASLKTEAKEVAQNTNPAVHHQVLAARHKQQNQPWCRSRQAQGTNQELLLGGHEAFGEQRNKLNKSNKRKKRKRRRNKKKKNA